MGQLQRAARQRQESGSRLRLIIVLIVVAVVAPLAAKAVQMAVSRQREYLADATSVQFTRHPMA
jgi:heat shock protein HtpX